MVERVRIATLIEKQPGQLGMAALLQIALEGPQLIGLEWLLGRQAAFEALDPDAAVCEINILTWLLLDSRVVEVPPSSTPTFVTLSFVNPFFFNGLKKCVPLLRPGGSRRPRNPIRAMTICYGM